MLLGTKELESSIDFAGCKLLIFKVELLQRLVRYCKLVHICAGCHGKECDEQSRQNLRRDLEMQTLMFSVTTQRKERFRAKRRYGCDLHTINHG